VELLPAPELDRLPSSSSEEVDKHQAVSKMIGESPKKSSAFRDRRESQEAEEKEKSFRPKIMIRDMAESLKTQSRNPARHLHPAGKPSSSIKSVYLS